MSRIIIWQDKNHRIKMDNDQSIIVEEKFSSPVYNDSIWLNVTFPERRAFLLENVLREIVRGKIYKPTNI